MNRKLTTILAGLSTAAAFAVNASDWLHGGTPSTGKACVSAVFIVLVSLLLYAWRKSNTAMCLLTIASALIAIGAANGLLMTADILPANSVLLPFSVFLVPFFGVTNFMASAFATMLLPLAVSVVWLCFAVGFWIHNRKSVNKTE
ncbi:hypothetical protein [uncultured Agathobaculum sp.]|uniref:hypothetical protein n=1 Tax=uncultured Agathobaculum sp. TaxID=2048140 RepID=UPI00296F0935